jgi:AraC-like DNA-binding protein
MAFDSVLKILPCCAVKAQNAGLFISRGQGTHPTRIIDSHELIYVKEGRLDMWEEDRTFALEAGQTLHLWPRRRHGGIGTLPAGLEFYWIHFELNEVTDSAGEAPVEIPQTCRVGRPEKLESLFRHFLDDQESGYLEACSANLLVVLMLLEAARPARIHKDDSDISTLATRANTYIRTHFHDPITPGKVAEVLGYNPDYLERVYRKVYGQTLTESIHRRRVRQACSYLLDTDMTIEQIARACGFSDADYFRRIFRRYQQSAPSTYRQLFTRVHVNTH